MGKSGKIKRFDIASILETAFEQNEWKGENHHRGVFFTDDSGYCVNKVLAVRAEHEEQAPKVFYSFFTELIDEQVTLEYPYKDMEMKPKKHHLLIHADELKEDELEMVFTLSQVICTCKTSPEQTREFIHEAVTNKRLRDRAQFVFDVQKEKVKMKVLQMKKNQIIAHDEKEMESDEINFESADSFRAIVNANTLHTVLSIFSQKTKVLFQFARDRMKITGSLSTSEGKQARVEVVLALMKG